MRNSSQENRDLSLNTRNTINLNKNNNNNNSKNEVKEIKCIKVTTGTIRHENLFTLDGYYRDQNIKRRIIAEPDLDDFDDDTCNETDESQCSSKNSNNIDKYEKDKRRLCLFNETEL